MYKLLEHIINEQQLEEFNAKQLAGSLALAGTLALAQPNVADAMAHHPKHHHHQTVKCPYNVGHTFKGEASTYGWGEKLNPTTADGSRFNGEESFVAMEKVPLGTIVTVKDLKTGKQHDFTVKDFGPGKRTHRIIDLSKGAWKQFGYSKPGLINTEVTIKSLGTGRNYNGKW